MKGWICISLEVTSFLVHNRTPEEFRFHSHTNNKLINGLVGKWHTATLLSPDSTTLWLRPSSLFVVSSPFYMRPRAPIPFSPVSFFIIFLCAYTIKKWSWLALSLYVLMVSIISLCFTYFASGLKVFICCSLTKFEEETADCGRAYGLISVRRGMKGRIWVAGWYHLSVKPTTASRKLLTGTRRTTLTLTRVTWRATWGPAGCRVIWTLACNMTSASTTPCSEQGWHRR